MSADLTARVTGGSPTSALLLQPGGFEGLLPLLMDADSFDSTVADRPDVVAEVRDAMGSGPPRAPQPRAK
jgi:hypothetical protein